MGQMFPGKRRTLLATAVCTWENVSQTESSNDPAFNSEGEASRIRKCNQPSQGTPHCKGAAVSSSTRPAGVVRIVAVDPSDSSSSALSTRRCQFFRSPAIRSVILLEPSAPFRLKYKSSIPTDSSAPCTNQQ